MVQEQQANLQDGAHHLLLVWSNRHLPTEETFTTLEMSLPPFFSSTDSCSLASVLICSTWFGFRSNILCMQLLTPGSLLVTPQQPRQGRPGQGPVAAQAPLGLML